MVFDSGNRLKKYANSGFDKVYVLWRNKEYEVIFIIYKNS